MSIVIGFVSEKGGVGKTTVAYHVAVDLHRRHRARVLVLDTDYQRGGLTCRLLPELLEDFKAGNVDGTIYSAFRALYSDLEEEPQLSRRNTSVGVDLIAAHPRLNSVSLDKMPERGNLRETNQMLLNHLLLIDHALAKFHTDYDYVLIDSHPDLHDLERSVIAACDFVVSPVKLDQQSVVGVASTVKAITEVNEDIDFAQSGREYSPTMFLGALATMCREYGGSLKYSETLMRNRLMQTTGMLDSYITEGDGLRQAAERSCPVFDVTTTSNAVKQGRQIQDVTDEIVERCGPSEDANDE